MPRLGLSLDSLPSATLVQCTLMSSGELDLKKRTHGASPFPREDPSGTRKWTRDWWPEPSSGKYFHCLPTEGMAEGDYLLSRERAELDPLPSIAVESLIPFIFWWWFNFSEGYMLYSTGNHGNHHLYIFSFNFHLFHSCPHLPPHLLGVCSPGPHATIRQPHMDLSFGFEFSMR